MSAQLTLADSLLLLVLAAGIGWLFAHSWSPPVAAASVRISSPDGSQRYPLTEPRELEIHGPLGTSQLQITTQGVRFVDSPCRHRICVRSGWHRRAGAVAACVPNRISVVLSGGHSRLDGVSY